MRLVKTTVSLMLVLILSCSMLTPFGMNVQSASAAGLGMVTVVTSQAGFSKVDMKVGSVITDEYLQDVTFDVKQGATVVYSDTLSYEGKTWGKHVYTADFSSLEQIGSNFMVESNGASSHSFSIEDNIWLKYRDEMTAYYRILRASVDIADVLPPGYTDTPLSPEAYHDAGHMDDGWDRDGVFDVWDITLDDGTQPAAGLHYDLTGGHYDAGDYGKYAGNQWVGGQLALAYLRHSDSPAVQFDYDSNGVPDIIEEARVNGEYTLKFVDYFDGAIFDIPRKGGFKHPIYETDGMNLSPAGNPDDREIGQLSVGGTAKAAGMMAATARSYQVWKVKEQINIPDVDDFISRSTAGAIKAYEFAYNNPDKNEGSGYTTNDLTNPLLWAEVELYLLTNQQVYYDRATQRIAILDAGQIRNTGYWDVRPIALADFYPVANSTTQTKIQQLLKSEVDRFISSQDDTPYGVLNEFSNFGVNEPTFSMIGDIVRYYELFGGPEILTAAKKGLYWVFGNNPWNISWVSGVGDNHVKYPHSRFDQDAYGTTNPGIVHTGAMVAGPTIKDPANRASVTSPWYEDRSLAQDGTAQWRYNEHSVSIQAGLFYTIMAMSSLDEPSTVYPNFPQLPVLSPQTGDFVTGDVNVIVAQEAGVSNVRYGGSTMQASNGVWTSSFNTDGYMPYDNRRVTVTGEIDAGQTTIKSSAHYSVAPPLPSPSTPLLYDGFGKDGTFGYQSLGWQNWYTQDGSKDGTYSKETLDGRTVGKFTHNPSTAIAQARFQPWHDKVDWSGYRYMYVTLKNSGAHPGLLYKVQVSGKNATNYATASNEWTTLKIDLDQIAGLDKHTAQIAIWLKGEAASGDIFIDDIYAGNEATGTAPTLTNVALNQAAGDERTEFHYSVTYSDVDNKLPHTVQLITDGVVNEMMESDATDQNVADGKQYMLSKSLVQGPHQFYVRTTDTTSEIVMTAVQSGPVVSPASEPFDRPTAPRNLHAVTRSASTVMLEWLPSEDDREVSEYGIYQDELLINSVSAEQYHYDVTDLMSGTAFNFHIKAHSETQLSSEASNVIAIQTEAEFTSPTRFLGQFAGSVNERKKPNEYPTSPDGFGKAWRGGKAAWTVTFPEARAYDFVVRAFPEGSAVSMQVRVDGLDVPDAAWSLSGGWNDYEGSLGVLSAGTHIIEVRNNSPISGNLDIAHMDIVGALPGDFQLKSPMNEATVSSTSVMLDWTQEVIWRDNPFHFAPFGADDYTVVVADNAELLNPIVDLLVTETTYQLENLQFDTTYYWQVIANNANGSTHSDATFSFTTPASPVMSEPARYLGQYAVGANERKGITDWPGNATATPEGWGKVWQKGVAKWSVHFPETGEYNFSTRVFGEGANTSFLVRIDGMDIPGASWGLSKKWVDYTGTLGVVTAGTHLIEIYNNSAITNNNVDVAHMDIFGAAPGQFKLMSPANEAAVEDIAVTLNWTQVISNRSFAPFGAKDYVLIVADNAEFMDPISETTVTTTTHQINNLAYDSTYYWKVIANNANGSTHSDATFSFTTPTLPDDVAPVTVVEIQGELFGEWYRSDVLISLTATDEGTGVAQTEYRLHDEQTWTVYDHVIIIPEEGTQSIDYRSIDYAGNVEEAILLTFGVDKTAPTWSITNDGETIQNNVVYLDNQAHAFKLVAEDLISGVSETTFMLDGIQYESEQIVSFAGRLGEHKLEISAVDHAGNLIEAEITIQVTTSLPSLEELLTQYIASGDVSGPLVPQLSNILAQVKHQIDKGDQAKAAKHMEKLLKHLNNPAMSGNVSEAAKAVLTADANALIDEWKED